MVMDVSADISAPTWTTRMRNIGKNSSQGFFTLPNLKNANI